MTRADALDWVEINDFRPGIVHNLGVGSQGALTGYGPGAQGMASMDGTNDCIALPHGGLGPLPRRDSRIIRTTFATGGSINFRVQFHIFGPVATDSNVPQRIDFRRADRQYAEFLFSLTANNGTGRLHKLEQAKMWNVVPASGVYDYSANVQQIVFTTEAGAASAFYPPTIFASTMLNPTTPTALGNPTTIIHHHYVGTQYYTYAWPDPTNLSSTTPVDITTAARMKRNQPVFTHQNRIAMIEYTLSAGWGGAGAAGQQQTLGAFAWSQPNTWVAETAGETEFGPEDPFGYGAWYSISSSDLLLVKYSGGGLLVQGDLNYPIVRKLPGVTSTGGVWQHGASGPGGFCYGVSRDGVYAIQGESSQLISPQLPPDFWVTVPNSEGVGYQGQFAWWNHWLLCPGSWLYDSDTGGWWRLTGSADGLGNVFGTYQWQINPTNSYAWGVPWQVTDTGSGTFGIADGWNRALGSQTYSWRSQPLYINAPDEIIRVREIVLIVQGAGQVTVTFDADLGSSPAKVLTLTGSTTAPQSLRASVAAHLQGNVRVRFQADSLGASAAPIIYAARIGTETAQRVGRG